MPALEIQILKEALGPWKNIVIIMKHLRVKKQVRVRAYKGDPQGV
jgi:hypothetical protein